MTDTTARDKRILELYFEAKRGGTARNYTDIATQLSAELGQDISMTLVRGVVRRWRDHNMPTPVADKQESLTEVWREYFENRHSVSAGFSVPDKVRKAVVCGDIHGRPNAALFRVIADENPDLIVIGGDVYDAAQASSHGKLPGERRDSFKDEVARVRVGLEYLLDNTRARLIVIRGNHDDRIYKRLSELLPDYLLDLFPDPLQLLIQDLPRCELSKVRWQFNAAPLADTAYVALVGDMLVSHLDKTGTEAGDAVKKLAVWIDGWRRTLNCDPVVLVQTHAHKKAILWQDSGNRVLIEPGIAAEPMIEGYKVQYGAKWKPASVGAVALTQELRGDDWQTDLASVRMLGL